MDDEQVFRAAFVGIFVLILALSSWHRWKARRIVGAIPRHREGAVLILARVTLAVPLYLAILLYMVHPPWMAWSQVALPSWLRWVGVCLGAAMVPVIYWVFRSLGSNISETILTKEGQSLVTWGPYRWVRHPLYSTAWTVLGALSLVAANWAMALLVAVVAAALPLVAKREEAELLDRFGPAYVTYMARTGRFVPRTGMGVRLKPWRSDEAGSGANGG